MLDFIFSNPIIMIIAVLLFMAFLVVCFLGPKKKNKKVEKVFPSKKEGEEAVKTETSTAEVNDVEQKETTEIETTEPETITEKVEKTETDDNSAMQEAEHKSKLFNPKQKPKIERIYKRETTETAVQPTQVEPDINEEELMKQMQFVSTSKKVSKLKSVSNLETAKDVEDLPKPEEEAKSSNQTVKNKVRLNSAGERYFNRSRRISRCIECGSIDEIFCPHLSDRYLNINIDRHLKNDEKFSENLYSRTTSMLANSGAKFSVSVDDENNENDITPSKQFKNDKEYMKDWIEKRRREELTKLIIEEPTMVEDQTIEDTDNLTVRNILLTDSIMKRKSLRKRA